MTIEQYVDAVHNGSMEEHDVRVFSKMITPTWNRTCTRSDADIYLTMLGEKNSLVLNSTEKQIAYYNYKKRTLGDIPLYCRVFKKVGGNGVITILLIETNNANEIAFIDSLEECENKDINSFGLHPDEKIVEYYANKHR